MTDRERLVELIRDKTCGNNACVPFLDCEKCGNFPLADKDVDRLADLILADGWMRPPVKVGQKIYYNNEYTDEKTLESKCESIAINEDGIQVIFYDFYRGKVSLPARYVYATKEEAEKALRGGESDA